MPADDVVGAEQRLAAVQPDSSHAELQPWEAGYGAKPTVVHEEGWFERAARKLKNAGKAALSTAGAVTEALSSLFEDTGEAVTKSGIQQRTPGVNTQTKRKVAEVLGADREQNPALASAADDVAERADVAGAARENAGDVGRAGGRLAYDALEAEGGARLAGAAIGALGRVGALSSRALGAEGEALVIRQLEAKGYTEVTAIQNRSGHGIDILARNKAGDLRFFEVKTSTTGKAGSLSPAQRYTEEFITTRLDRAAQAQGPWRNLDPAVRQKAADTLAEIRGGASIKGVKIDVMYPPSGAQGPPTLRFSRWRED